VKTARTAKPLKEALKHGDERLLREIRHCEEEDSDYSPPMDRIRHTSGLEYEFKLQRELSALGVLFEAEDDLRNRGFHKTPDILLPIPIGFIFPDQSEQKPRIIRWIDSKAMFGDVHTHVNDNKDQIQGYVNRYGPGMVIYWFGFMPSISNAYPDVYVTSEIPVDSLVTL
jgi:hypothetical protein